MDSDEDSGPEKRAGTHSTGVPASLLSEAGRTCFGRRPISPETLDEFLTAYANAYENLIVSKARLERAKTKAYERWSHS